MKNQLKTIKIQGKEYAEVHTRINHFRSSEQYKNWGEDCQIIHQTDTSILIKATIYYPDGRIASSGHAKEDMDGSRINQRNHVENCETSAVGRALGFLGIGISEGSIASYEEVANAIANKNKDDIKKELDLGLPKKPTSKPTGNPIDDMKTIQKGIEAGKDFKKDIIPWLKTEYKDQEHEIFELK